MSDLQDYIDAKNAETQAWIDEDPANRMAGFIPEAEFWASEYNITTVAQYERHNMEATIYDLHKDVYGFRNRGYDFKNMTDGQLQTEYDHLLECLEINNKMEAEMEAAAIKSFELKVNDLITSGAGDRETAIRWLREAEQDEQIMYDDDYFCWDNGLPYGYLKRAA